MPEDFPVAPGKNLKFVYATRRDTKGLQSWRDAVHGKNNPILLDAVELATLAFRRWREAKTKGRVASSIQEIKDFIQDNPHAEVAVLILAKAPWLRKRTLLGLCHFHRTWANNLYIDLLTSHPLIARNLHSPIRGVGTALLYFVSGVGAEIGAKAIWGEATQNSAHFYRKVLGRSDVDDRFYLSETEYLEFKSRIEKKVQPAVPAGKPGASARTAPEPGTAAATPGSPAQKGGPSANQGASKN